ncbi:succinate dehydrogenase cytochrome b560 subunit, mitochondrial-like isoform X2 [Haliotis rufescens]|uniref:succinate dehydrogenase cytochrome b560 subunit, mitochondrial-like isoform X2 n=1 Tax=Haliotis rufescens TaxID=6454 RepID=UPI00201FAF09|nr:succinate dehydrogenase cytochrome b560 subunit, mitochondrial-like isoform X2 [Haliotis rufescens]
MSKQPSGRMSMTSSRGYEEMKQYWEKNRALSRPLSPFLTYKPHLVMSMSLTHRITGVYLTVVVSGVSVLMLCLPESYPYYLQMIKDLSLGPAILTGMKYSLALPVAYHFLNGIRHLAWDAGYGFGKKDMYTSGYLVLALSLAISSMMVFML